MKRNYFVLCLLSLSISPLTMAQTDPGTANLTHQWTFDDGTADDNVGTVNGTLMGSANISDGALNTNGGYVELDGAALAINTYSEMTVSACQNNLPTNQLHFSLPAMLFLSHKERENQVTKVLHQEQQ